MLFRSMGTMTFTGNIAIKALWGIAAVIMACASGFIQIAMAEHCVQGFEIHGAITYIVLIFTIGIFSV